VVQADAVHAYLESLRIIDVPPLPVKPEERS
jgi:hypothetical protein